MPDTIPGLLVAAADRDAEGSWVRTDEGSLSFAGAVSQVAGLAARLSEEGVRRGDLVVVTTRTTPPYLLCWLALASLGAVTVPTDPAGTVDELHGLIGQVRPRLVVSDAELVPALEQAGVGDALRARNAGHPHSRCRTGSSQRRAPLPSARASDRTTWRC